jgi:hypothetical protein
MLAAFLLAGIIAAPLGSIALLTPGRTRTGPPGNWSATRRFALALAGTVVLAALVAVVLKLLGVSEHRLILGVAGVVVASLVWLPATRRWTARAHLCWATSVFLFVAYLAYALDWTINSHLGPASTAGGLVLWLFELFAAVMSCAYLWEICDALGTEHWRRRITAQTRLSAADKDLPMVSLHVPAHNEPPEMVKETLRSLLRLDYPRYEIVVIDDNTDDERLWRPVEEWCARHRVKFAHLENWPGYKSGALNYALRRLTDERAELIGVVDSDYQLEPGFLRRCAPPFADAWIGFVQSPQDYRDWETARYYRRLYYSYKYFFAVSQPSRNEHDGAIFAGTMGLIRRVALDELGGWDEWCITEDAEVSLRLLRAGWHGLHVDQGEPPQRRAALGLPGRWRAVVRRPARPGVLRLPAGRRGEPGERRGRAVPQAHPVPAGDRAGAGGSWAGPGGGTVAPRHRRPLAGRARCVLHLAVHLPGRGARVGAWPVRPQGGVPAHAEDQ